MSIVIPILTDVTIDLGGSVRFIASGKAALTLNAVVSFTHPGGPQGVPVKDYPGSALAIAPNATGTIVTATVGPSGGFFVGFQAAGDTNGNYFIAINNVLINRLFTNIFNQNVDYNTPGQVTLSPGDTISLTCLNTGLTTADYNGTIFGSF